MTQFIFANDAISTLAVAVAPTDMLITVAAGTGGLFPNPATDAQRVALTVQDAATGLIKEIMYGRTVKGDTISVERAQEGTTAQAWAVGDKVSNFVTAATAANFVQDIPEILYTVATLPSPTPAGQTLFVKDSNEAAPNNFGYVVAGGGNNFVPVYSDGTNWLIG